MSEMANNIFDEIYTKAMKDAYDALVFQKEYEREQGVRAQAITNTEQAYYTYISLKCRIKQLSPDVIGFPMDGKLKLAKAEGLYAIKIGCMIPAEHVVSIYGITEESDQSGLVMMEYVGYEYPFGKIMLRPDILMHKRHVFNLPFPSAVSPRYISITLYSTLPEVSGVYVLGVMGEPGVRDKITSVVL